MIMKIHTDIQTIQSRLHDLCSAIAGGKYEGIDRSNEELMEHMDCMYRDINTSLASAIKTEDKEVIEAALNYATAAFDEFTGTIDCFETQAWSHWYYGGLEDDDLAAEYAKIYQEFYDLYELAKGLHDDLTGSTEYDHSIAIKRYITPDEMASALSRTLDAVGMNDGDRSNKRVTRLLAKASFLRALQRYRIRALVPNKRLYLDRLLTYVAWKPASVYRGNRIQDEDDSAPNFLKSAFTEILGVSNNEGIVPIR